MKRKFYRFGALLNLMLALILTLNSCGKLPEEKVKAFKQEMGEREIKRVLESDIITHADKMGLAIRNKIDSLGSDAEQISQLESQYNVKIELIKNERNYSEAVTQIMDAYLFSAEKSEKIESNVQKLPDGDLFYSSPVLEDSAGIKKLQGVWGITIKKAGVIRELTAGSKDAY